MSDIIRIATTKVMKVGIRDWGGECRSVDIEIIISG